MHDVRPRMYLIDTKRAFAHHLKLIKYSAHISCQIFAFHINTLTSVYRLWILFVSFSNGCGAVNIAEGHGNSKASHKIGQPERIFDGLAK